MFKSYLKLNKTLQHAYTNVFAVIILLLLTFNLSSCSNKKPKNVSIPENNTLERMYKETPEFVFKKLQQVLEQEFSFTFDFVDNEKFILSTSEIREKSINGPKKYRVNASVHIDKETGASTLRLYKQEKTYINNSWKNTMSDKVLEDSIFEALKK